MEKEVFIVSAKRTALGSFLGAFKDVKPSLLGAEVIKEIVTETGVKSEDIDEVLVGNILPAGQGQGIARQVSIHAGLGDEVVAYGVNMVCGSGLKTVMNGYNSIQTGWHKLVLAGGTESMSQSPFIVPYTIRSGQKMGALNMVDHMLNDALFDAFDGQHMGITAENVAAKYNISREEQDEFAIHSQEKAIKAVDGKVFADEIVPVKVMNRKEEIIVDTDEYPNRKTSLEKLASLRPAFKKDGSVTAGNSSGINDGASFVLLADKEMVEKYGWKPLAKIVGIGQGGVNPTVMGLGPTPAIRHALTHAGLKLEDIDRFELNEAFAAQALGVIHELAKEHGISEDDILAKSNVNGGAIALGHPVGASGNRILVTLVHELKRSGLRYGLASLCIGGGMGAAVIIERV